MKFNEAKPKGNPVVFLDTLIISSTKVAPYVKITLNTKIIPNSFLFIYSLYFTLLARVFLAVAV